MAGYAVRRHPPAVSGGPTTGDRVAGVVLAGVGWAFALLVGAAIGADPGPGTDPSPGSNASVLLGSVVLACLVAAFGATALWLWRARWRIDGDGVHLYGILRSSSLPWANIGGIGPGLRMLGWRPIGPAVKLTSRTGMVAWHTRPLRTTDDVEDALAAADRLGLIPGDVERWDGRAMPRQFRR